MSEYGVAIFASTASVMRAEKVLQAAGILVKLVPTPRQFSSDCGIAVRFGVGDMDRARSALEKANLTPEGLHQM